MKDYVIFYTTPPHPKKLASKMVSIDSNRKVVIKEVKMIIYQYFRILRFPLRLSYEFLKVVNP